MSVCRYQLIQTVRIYTIQHVIKSAPRVGLKDRSKWSEFFPWAFFHRKNIGTSFWLEHQTVHIFPQKKSWLILGEFLLQQEMARSISRSFQNWCHLAQFFGCDVKNSVRKKRREWGQWDESDSNWLGHSPIPYQAPVRKLDTMIWSDVNAHMNKVRLLFQCPLIWKK